MKVDRKPGVGFGFGAWRWHYNAYVSVWTVSAGFWSWQVYINKR